MTDMRKYVCWTDKAVLAVTPRDAASLRPGHFHAVHHPLKLQRRPLGSLTGGRWVEETEIVRVLEGPLRPDGYLLVPIVGGSGTGKSHLVRWVWNRTKDRNNWESRYLAKNRTSLRQAIAKVIEGLEGPAINNAREALHKAPAQSESESVLAERLLDELALITAGESGAAVDVRDRKAAQLVAKLRRELPDILRDPVVRRRLTGSGAVIPRLVGLAKRGRVEGDGLDDNAIRVVEDDLPLRFAEIDQASKGVQKLLTQLAGLSNLRSAAVNIINDALPTAVNRVFLSGQVNLIEVFREVRRELFASDKELVLFIEDLTVLHGVEREFLDAIIEPARSADGNLCTLRVLFAVTEGHFDGLDTVRTRCDDAYRLDAVYGQNGIGHGEAMSFLGRYLNACRQDPTEVETLWDDRQRDGWLPNACDTCDYQVHCHETFGRSEQGYGLYPYNPAAVNRFVKSVSGARFDPREVVRELVNRFLIVAATDLQRGEFPSEELVGSFHEGSEPLDPLLQSEIKLRRPADSARILNSIRYWSESSAAVGDETLAAFGLEGLGELERLVSGRSQERDKRTSRGAPRRHNGVQTDEHDAPVSSRLRSPWSKIFEDLNTWADKQRDLNASATNNLKKLVHKSILQNLDASALPTNLGPDFDQRLNREKHLHIAGSVTDQRRGTPIVLVKQDVETAAALKGLILLSELPDASDYPRASDYRRRAARYLEEWVLCVEKRLGQPPEPAANEAITGLLVCAVVAGACEEASDPHEYLEALFEAPSSVAGPHRSQKWQEVVKAADTTHRRLRPIVEAHFGERRGTGATRAIRADQILTVIHDFTDSGRLESTDAATDAFMRSVISAVNEEWATLELLATGAAPLLDPSRSWSKQTDRVLELIENANRSGRLRDHDAARDLRELTSYLDENAHKDLLRTSDLVCQDLSLITRLRVIASSRPDTVTTISRFLTRANQAMSGIEKDLDERRAGESQDETLEDVASNVLAAVDRLTKTVERV